MIFAEIAQLSNLLKLLLSDSLDVVLMNMYVFITTILENLNIFIEFCNPAPVIFAKFLKLRLTVAHGKYINYE